MRSVGTWDAPDVTDGDTRRTAVVVTSAETSTSSRSQASPSTKSSDISCFCLCQLFSTKMSRFRPLLFEATLYSLVGLHSAMPAGCEKLPPVEGRLAQFPRSPLAVR